MENYENNKTPYATSEELARHIVSVLIEKKALDVRLYNVGEDSSVTDFYVNATGNSLTNVSSLADEIAYKTSERGREPLRFEGKHGSSWILVDYGDVIVNIFDKPSREFYNLDRLMNEQYRVNIDDIIAEVDKKFEIKS